MIPSNVIPEINATRIRGISLGIIWGMARMFFITGMTSEIYLNKLKSKEYGRTKEQTKYVKKRGKTMYDFCQFFRGKERNKRLT